MNSLTAKQGWPQYCVCDFILEGVWKNMGIKTTFVRFEAFTAVKIHVEVFWVVMPCSVVVVWTSEMLVSFNNTTVLQPRRP
jgi:hypothetical protein